MSYRDLAHDKWRHLTGAAIVSLGSHCLDFPCSPSKLYWRLYCLNTFWKSMSNHNCCVFGCFNTAKKAKQEGRELHFYRFPFRQWENERRQKWIQFVKRKGNDGKPWHPTKYSAVCSDHFISRMKSEDPRCPDYIPTIYRVPVYAHGQKLKRYGRLVKRKLQLGLDFDDESKQPEIGNDIDTETEMRVKYCEVAIQTEPESLENLNVTLEEYVCVFDGNNIGTTVHHKNVPVKRTETLDVHCGSDSRTPSFSGFVSLGCEKTLKDLTSVSFNVFALLLSLLPKSDRRGELKAEDKLLLFLMKLKQGISFASVGALFSVHERTASRIFASILTIIYAKTKSWIYFPSKYAVRNTLPQCFREKYPTCRIIIDCTEVKTETPTSVEQRILMYSNYKGTFTAKYLIGITPSGFICYVSPGYGGRATDSFITNDCGVLNNLEEEDVVLADKGFPHVKIKDGVLLIMPPFSKPGSEQFSTQETFETYKVASVRIHVERAIQRIKVYNILNNRISPELLPCLDMIMHVCCLLANLGPPLIKK